MLLHQQYGMFDNKQYFCFTVYLYFFGLCVCALAVHYSSNWRVVGSGQGFHGDGSQLCWLSPRNFVNMLPTKPGPTVSPHRHLLIQAQRQIAAKYFNKSSKNVKKHNFVNILPLCLTVVMMFDGDAV